MPTLSSKLIEGTKPEAATLLEIQQKFSIPSDKSMNFMVLETSFKDKKVYCCWSGGAIEDGEAKFTLIGRAALEALVNLPLGNDNEITIQEIKMGATPLKDKIRSIIMNAEAGAKICFVGDMEGELDGHMSKVFNLAKGTIKVAH